MSSPNLNPNIIKLEGHFKEAKFSFNCDRWVNPSILVIFQNSNPYITLYKKSTKFSKSSFNFSHILSTLSVEIPITNEIKVYPTLSIRKFFAEAHGWLSFWPFAEDLISTLGSKCYFTGDCNFYEYSSYFKLNYRAIKANVGYSSIKGRGEVTSWKPLFMGIGVDDLRMDSLPKCVDFFSLGFSFSHNLGKLGIGYEIAQIIPIHVNGNNANGIKVSSKSLDQTRGRTYSISLNYQLK
ncbi:MAG: hypothetical protein QMD71_01335 [bacterium]|nr:hypothetical protein [bacterium]